MAVPCRIVSIVTDRLLQVLTRGEPARHGLVQTRGGRTDDQVKAAKIQRRQDAACDGEIGTRKPAEPVAANGLARDVRPTAGSERTAIV
jgi:hypothetical protein